jgi:DNA-binding beta-propeller fold protein YncE
MINPAIRVMLREGPTLLRSASILLTLAAAALGAEEYRFVGQWGKSGTGTGHFRRPVSVAVGSSNTVYVVDQDNHRIQKFNGDGMFLTAWGMRAEGPILGSGGAGNTAGQFRVPSGVACDDAGNVFVCEWGKSRVQAFSPDGAFLRKWGGEGKNQGLFAFPTGLAAGRGCFVYVADQDNGRVQKFREDGTFVAQFRQTGCSPYGLAVGPGGNVVVIDTHGRYWVFTPEGGLVGWRGRGTRVEDGTAHRTGWFGPEETYSYEKQVGFWGETGPFDGDGEFFEPRGIAVDSQGNVFVADTRNHRIQKFTANGAFLCKWGSRGRGPGQFDFPYGVAVDGAGNVYVADKYNNRIQKFAIPR